MYLSLFRLIKFNLSVILSFILLIVCSKHLKPVCVCVCVWMFLVLLIFLFGYARLLYIENKLFWYTAWNWNQATSPSEWVLRTTVVVYRVVSSLLLLAFESDETNSSELFTHNANHSRLASSNYLDNSENNCIHITVRFTDYVIIFMAKCEYAMPIFIVSIS